jgi:hypothetical protein
MKLNLYDIKELSNIPDNSFYIFSLLIIIVFVILLSFLILYKIKKRKKEKTFRVQALEKLNNINLNDTKKSAYIISKYGRVLIQDERSKKLFDELFTSLEKYKYTQLVPRFEKDIFVKLQLFKESIGIS